MVEKPTFEKLGEGTEKAEGTRSEDSGCEMAHRHYKRFYEAMEAIDEAIQSGDRVDRMLDKVMEKVLQIFECDRAWLFYPCDPDADSFRVTVESTTKEFPGAKALGKEVPMTADMADYCWRALAASGEAVIDPPEGCEMGNDIAIQFDVKSLMLMALYPRVGERWMFGLHQCDHRRDWSQADRRLFRRIGFRITDALSSRLYLQQLEESEKALRDREKEFRTLIENIVDWVWKVDVNGCYTYVSPQMESIMGYPISEVLGKTPFDFMRPEEAERVRSMYGNALADHDRIEGMEDTLLAKDGRAVVFETNATPIFDEGGDFQGYMGTCRDITERKRSEAALRASEERFDLAMRFANDGLFDWNLETNEIYYSPVWKRILGYEDHEIENKFSEWERLTKADDVKSSWAMMREVVAGRKGRFEIEFQMRHKEGHWVDILARANVVRDDRGKPLRVLGTHVDVTQRKRGERDLEKVKEHLEALWSITKIADADIKSISDHVLAVVEKMTASKHAFYGFLTEDEKTMVLHAWSPKTMADCRVTNKPVYFRIDKAGIWADAVRQRRTVILNDYPSDRQGKKDLPEGHVDLTRFMVVPVVSHNKVISVAAVANKKEAYTEADEKQVRGFLANVQILLDRKQAEREKLELMTRLQHVQKMEAIGTLAGGVAHDFNNILSPILVQTELAKLNLPQDHAIQENLDEVLKAGHRAADLVKHILTFSRQEKQKHVIFDMKGTVNEVLKLIRATIPSSIEIIQRISAEPATIMGDPTGIHEVLMNLCSNAAQAMDEMGSVLQVELREVELDREFVKELPGVSPGSFVRLSVSDTGHGIPREVIGRIFDPYFTTKEVGKGTGMGLAVAHGVVKEHGGAITVYSEPGQGTTFHVLFPKAQGEVIESGAASKGVQTGTERILFVDDEEAIVRSGTQMLELLGYEVRSTTVPVEALEMFRAEPNEFDLVITDMTMPHMTGEVLAREMMDIRPDIPIILCTGFSYRIDEQKAKDIGIKGWIMKPFIMRETADMIRNVLGG